LYDPQPFGSKTENPSGDAAAGIANQLMSETSPLRQNMISNWSDMLGGNYDMSQSPLYGQAKYNIGSQFDTARNNIMSALPSGGGLQKAIADTYTQEAGSMANAMGNAWQDEYNKAYGMASGAPQMAISGLGIGAGATAAQNSAKMGKTGDVGQGLGYFLGGK